MIKFLRYFMFPAVFFFFSCNNANPALNNSISLADSTTLHKHVNALVSGKKFRNYIDTITLNKAAGYIAREFYNVSDRVEIQKFEVEGTQYKNIICSLGPQNGERIIIGAHYDVCGNQAGADDNASGVAGLLELARLLKTQKLKYRIDFVAYTLEEPPFFRSTKMGSYMHAKFLNDNNIDFKGMICLEMIGYFNDKPNTQKYPVGLMKWFYGGTADYIMVVQKFGNGSFGRKFNQFMRNAGTIKTHFLRSPKFITGVDFSDHRNYWKFGYNALMITNTAFYRNSNYHTEGDFIETLDFKRMAKVVNEVYLSVLKF